MIRTVLTEAAPDDVAGQAAVASVIRNRLSAGGYGDNPAAIVTAPNQFEVWSNGSAQRVDPNSAAYRSAGEVVDAIANGDVDPTGGATHFYSPSGQASLGRPAPAWAQGRGVQFGGNVFYAPNGPVNTNAPPQPFTSQPSKPVASSNLDELSNWGLDPKTLAAAPSKPTPSAAPVASADPLDELSKWGIDPKTFAAQPASPAAVAKPGPAAKHDPGAAGAAVLGAVNGIPIAGPMIMGGLNRAAAGLHTLVDGTPYDQNLADAQAVSTDAQQQHPTATMAGNVAGAVGGMVPAIAAAPEAFGIQGATMLGRIGAGAVSGGAIGAADAGVRGQSPLAGAGFGAAGGAAGPLAGHVLGGIVDAGASGVMSGGNALMNYLRTGSGTGIKGVGRSAADTINQVMQDPAVVQQFLAQHGDMAMLADADPSLTALAGGLASKPGPEQAVIRNALMQRAGGSADRISDQVAATIGPEQSNVALDAAYKGIRSANGDAYIAVHAAAPPVDVSPVVADIDHQLETATGPQRVALLRWRDEMVATPAGTDPQTGLASPEAYQNNSQVLHNIRQDIDGTIKYGNPQLGIQPGSVSRTQGSIAAVRGSLDDALKTQVPGMADADARSALDAANTGAVSDGYNSVLGGNVPHPADFLAARDANNPATNAAMNAGMASRIYRMFGTGTQRDAVTLNKLLAGGEDGYSAQNLSTAFGEQPTNALLDTLSREKAFNNTTQAVTQNSETARRTAANQLLDATQPGSMDLKNATMTGLGLQSAKALANPIIKAIMESPDAPRNMELARVLTAQGASRDEILSQLLRLNSRNSTMTGIGAGLRSAVAGGTNRLLLTAGSTKN